MSNDLYSDKDRLRFIDLNSPTSDASKNPWRGDFARDYARLLHSPCFRRLQGKMQLFSGAETDFFRNRLTHSLEVAQISKGIATRLNATVKELKNNNPINIDVVQFAGLAHDLGHPPFGHTGETALNRNMLEYGGFEGNAQTLRILTKLEKKLDSQTEQLSADGDPILFENGAEKIGGLNLTYRTLLSVLKYDRELDPKNEVKKGYYKTEADLVDRLKVALVGGESGEVKSVECQIMDIADDIAYSTYDIEDAFKANFLSPFEMMSLKVGVLEIIAQKTSKAIRSNFSNEDVKDTIDNVVGELLFEETQTHLTNGSGIKTWEDFRKAIERGYLKSSLFASNGYYRGIFTSKLVDRFIGAISLEYNEEKPILSRIKMEPNALKEVEVLKHLTFAKLISSNRFKIVEHRGIHIVDTLFEKLKEDADELLPPDFQYRIAQANNAAKGKGDKEEKRARIICDFIAGMTDRYAVEFYGRLTSENPQTMFKDV